MGNACFCKNSNFIKDINLESSPLQPIVNTKSEPFIAKDDEDIEKKRINKLINYFNESEKEILNNLKKKEKSKKMMSKRKSSKKFDTLVDSTRYEVMLERLLAQKNIKRCGPKRRETIRNGDNTKKLVEEILKHNKDNIIKINKEELMTKKYSLIIKKRDFKGRLSVNIDNIAINGIKKNGIVNNKNKK